MNHKRTQHLRRIAVAVATQARKPHMWRRLHRRLKKQWVRTGTIDIYKAWKRIEHA